MFVSKPIIFSNLYLERCSRDGIPVTLSLIITSEDAFDSYASFHSKTPRNVVRAWLDPRTWHAVEVAKKDVVMSKSDLLHVTRMESDITALRDVVINKFKDAAVCIDLICCDFFGFSGTAKEEVSPLAMSSLVRGISEIVNEIRISTPAESTRPPITLRFCDWSMIAFSPIFKQLILCKRVVRGLDVARGQGSAATTPLFDYVIGTTSQRVVEAKLGPDAHLAKAFMDDFAELYKICTLRDEAVDGEPRVIDDDYAPTTTMSIHLQPASKRIIVDPAELKAARATGRVFVALTGDYIHDGGGPSDPLLVVVVFDNNVIGIMFGAHWCELGDITFTNADEASQRRRLQYIRSRMAETGIDATSACAAAAAHGETLSRIASNATRELMMNMTSGASQTAGAY
jgi:hypothetical protein